MTDIYISPRRLEVMQSHERVPCSVLEMSIDRCSLSYGVSPCAAAGAAGGECYNTYTTCQDKANYARTQHVMRFASRNVPSKIDDEYMVGGYVDYSYVVADEVFLRPYLSGSVSSPTVVDMDAGLSSRNMVTVTMEDETDNDSEQDPYIDNRATPAGGTYWARWIARNRNYYGRQAVLRKGFVAQSWDWNLFLDERYVIDRVALDNRGQAVITLKDPLKLTDSSTIPAPTNGALAVALPAVSNSGQIVSAGSATAKLPMTASSASSIYVGQELYIYSGTGAGQVRVISAYDGKTRTVTLSTAWAVAPDQSSLYEISPLQLTLDSGKGSQYADPATSGKEEYVRIGSEIIRYTAKSGDVLSWPTAEYRAQFGSSLEDHAAGDGAQLCRAFVDSPIGDVFAALLTESGVPASVLSEDIAAGCAQWYGQQYNITACISSPEQASSLIADLLVQIDAVMWWSPHAQKVEFSPILPTLDEAQEWNDEGNIIQGGTAMEMLDARRITQAAMYYGLANATANLSEPRSYMRGDVVVNVEAQTENEYGDRRQLVLRSRWFGRNSVAAVMEAISRKVARHAHPPKQFSLKIDPKDYSVFAGKYINVKTRRNVGFDGNPIAERCMVTRVDDKGSHVEIVARTTGHSGRYGFIAADNVLDYPYDSTYAHIADEDGKMSDGSDGYKII